MTPGNYLFEYAVIRYVPRVEREEFLNVGVILYCSSQKFLKTIFSLDPERIKAFYPAVDMDELLCHLNNFEQISAGNIAGGPIALLDLPSRFRWLTAVRSTVLQTSRVHPGFCIQPLETVERLHSQLVLG